LLGLFGFDIHDVFTGKAPLRVALAYINRLTIEPWSQWRAEQLGGPEHLGWTPDTYKQADLLDAMLVNAAVAGNVGSSKPPKMPQPTYRPKVKKEPEVQKVESLADFNIHAVMNAMGG
jgi:hypothetical protein